MRSTRRTDPSSAARPREPTRPVSPVAPRSERKRCRRPQTASAPCGRPRQTRHASDGSCRRPAKEPAPLARSSGHRRATPAHWLATPSAASPTHRAPARSVQNVHLPTRSQGESSPQTNPTQPAWQELFAFPMSRGIIRPHMKLNPQDLKNISRLTLEHYNQCSEEFWKGTRHHDVSQNVEALLQHIEGKPPFTILDFGCGPGR